MSEFHKILWEVSVPTEPETCRLIGYSAIEPVELPDYCFASQEEDTGLWAVYVEPYPPRDPLPWCQIVVVLSTFVSSTPIAIYHYGTEPFPYHRLYQARDDRNIAQWFLDTYPVMFLSRLEPGQYPVDPDFTIDLLQAAAKFMEEVCKEHS